MMTVQQALDALKQAHDNSGALADPTAVLYQAQLAWMQAVTDAITGSTVAPASDAPAVDVAALQQQNAELQAKVAAGESAVAAFEAALHPAEPAADAAPSSTNP